MKKSKLFIDKISFTISIKSISQKRHISRTLSTNDFVFPRFIKKKYIGGIIKSYYDTWQVLFNNGEPREFSVYLSFNPKVKTQSFLRIELNPNLAGSSGIETVMKYLELLIGKKEVGVIYSSAKVTLLHITLDVYNQQRFYYAHLPGVIISKMKWCHKLPISQDIGRSPLRLVIYDKNNEQLVKNIQTENSYYSWWRYEFNLHRHLVGCSIMEIRTHVSNPFLRLSLYIDDFLEDPYFTPQFIVQVKESGLNTAIYQLADEPMKRRYKHRLQQYKRDWMMPEKVWDTWPEALKLLKKFRL